MKRDPLLPAADETEAELSELFATLRDDRAPADLETRLLAGLAATTAASAGAAAAKGALWHKLGLWLTSGLAKSVGVGVLSAGAVCGLITVVDAPAGPAAQGQGGPSAGAVERAASRPAAAPAQEMAGDDEAESPSAAGGESRGSAAALRHGAGGPGVAAVAPAEPAPPAAVADSGSESAVNAAPPAAGVASGAAGETAALDELRREVLLVRAIAALVNAGRCTEARAASAAYRSERPAGQLAGEVDVLVERCQGQ